MPEPTEGEPHPFADIIDLFRELDAAQQPPGADPAEGATDPAPTAEPRGGIPVARTPRAPTPTRRRRVILLLPVALLALVGGAAATVIQHRDGPTPQTEQPVSPSSPATGATTPPSTAAVTDAAVPSIAADATGAAYGAALDRFAAATEADGVADAARSTRRTATRLRAAQGALARAEATHLASLVALGGAAADDRIGSFPSRVAAAEKAAHRVGRAAAGRSGVPDPSLATTNVVTLVATAVVGHLEHRVTGLAAAAADATLTAHLRAVATRAEALGTAASKAVTAVAGSPASTRAVAAAAALKALATLAVLDGDHLGSWASLAGPLRDALTAAGVADAVKDVAAVSATIAGAQRELLAWAADNASASAEPSSGGAGPQSAALLAAITRYQADASALIDRYATTVGALPLVAPGQQPSFELATRFYKNVKAFVALSDAVHDLHPPAGMGAAQRALAGLVAKGRAAATAGQSAAVDAEDCDPASGSCVLGSMKAWPSYERGVATLGDPGTVRATLASTARTA